MPKVFTSKTQKRGELGEEIACKYLISKGFEIMERNYTLKVGEIDIVVKKGKVVHFIEIKSSIGSFGDIGNSLYRPEENLHPKKLSRLYRTVEIYVMDKNVLNDWQIDLLTIYIDPITKKAKVELFEKI